MPLKVARPPPTIRFRAELGSSTLLPLPRTASAKLPKAMVEGTLNGFPFRAALEPGGLRVDKATRKAAGADAGDTVTVEITRTGEEPEIRVPLELRKALAAAPRARTLWEDITPNARRDWILWISTARQPETRKRRIENACDMLSSGKRRVCCFPGLKWLTKDRAPSGGTWIPLPTPSSEDP